MRKSAPLFCALLLSLSARRAWIEIECFVDEIKAGRSLSARRAWIEIHLRYAFTPVLVRSLSARRAWIEILCQRGRVQHQVVALRKESVDRNRDHRAAQADSGTVALRKESVDRNWDVGSGVCDSTVALRKESVDRNLRI